MKNLYAIAFWLLLGTLKANAQYSELSLQLESGLFSFQGSRTVSESFFNIVRDPSPTTVGSASYTNDPWSRRSGFSWGVTMQAQRVAKTKFIIGLQLGYESLATKTKINSGSDAGQFIAFQQGSSTFTYEYVNLHPFLGRRFGNRQVSLDLTLGVDAGVGLRNWENGKATSTTNNLYLTYHKHAMPALDLRPRINATAYYHNFGLSVSYARGLTNYSADWVGLAASPTTSQVWRIGIMYRLVNSQGKPAEDCRPYL